MRKLRITLLLAALVAVWSAPGWATTGTKIVTGEGTITTLTEDHQGNIIIADDGLTLDCAGHTVMEDGTGIGIQLIGRVGVTVKNCHVTNFQKGFVVTGSARNVFRDNRVDRNTDEGFDLNGAIGNLFIDNAVNNNIGDGFDLDDSHENIFKRNASSQNQRNGFELDNSYNNVFEENTAVGNGEGTADPSRSGFSLDGSGGNVFQRNAAVSNVRNGFLIETSPDNTFVENLACGNLGRGPGAGVDVFEDAVSDTDENTASIRNIFLENFFCSDNLTKEHPGFPGDKGFVLPGAD